MNSGPERMHNKSGSHPRAFAIVAATVVAWMALIAVSRNLFGSPQFESIGSAVNFRAGLWLFMLLVLGGWGAIGIVMGLVIINFI